MDVRRCLISFCWIVILDYWICVSGMWFWHCCQPRPQWRRWTVKAAHRYTWLPGMDMLTSVTYCCKAHQTSPSLMYRLCTAHSFCSVFQSLEAPEPVDQPRCSFLYKFHKNHDRIFLSLWIFLLMKIKNGIQIAGGRWVVVIKRSKLSGQFGWNEWLNIYY